LGSLTYVKFQWKKAANNNFDCFYCVKTICRCDHIFVFWNSFWDQTSFFPLQPNKLWTQTGKNHFTTFDFSFWLFKIQNVRATFRECCCFVFYSEESFFFFENTFIGLPKYLKFICIWTNAFGWTIYLKKGDLYVLVVLIVKTLWLKHVTDHPTISIIIKIQWKNTNNLAVR